MELRRDNGELMRKYRNEQEALGRNDACGARSSAFWLGALSEAHRRAFGHHRRSWWCQHLSDTIMQRNPVVAELSKTQLPREFGDEAR